MHAGGDAACTQKACSSETTSSQTANASTSGPTKWCGWQMLPQILLSSQILPLHKQTSPLSSVCMTKQRHTMTWSVQTDLYGLRQDWVHQSRVENLTGALSALDHTHLLWRYARPQNLSIWAEACTSCTMNTLKHAEGVQGIGDAEFAEGANTCCNHET